MKPEELFKTSDYVIIKNLIDSKTAQTLYDYTLKNIAAGNLKDDQVPGSPSFYQDKEMVSLHHALHPKIEALLTLKLIPTFCYYRTYRTNATLRMHKDRKSCDIAISLNLGQKGERWDLWLLDHDENAHNISLNPGDALIYRGCVLSHWRGKLIHADFVSQVFFFFANQATWRGRFIAKYELIRKFMKHCRRTLGIVSY